MILPPRLEYYGDKSKAAALKGKALGFYQWACNSMGGLQSVLRDKPIDENTLITVHAYKDAYGNVSGVVKIVVRSGGDIINDIYCVVSWGDGLDGSTYLYNDTINNPLLFDMPIKSGGNGYWFNKDKSECVSWIVNRYYSFNLIKIIYRNQYLFFNQKSNHSVVLCCAVIKGYLYVIELSEVDGTKAQVFLSKLKIESDYTLTELASRLLVDGYYQATYWFAYEGNDNSAFSIDGKTAVIRLLEHDSVAGQKNTVCLVEFNDDYSENTTVELFDCGDEYYGVDLLCHGDDITLAAFPKLPRTDATLFFYDKASQTIDEYQRIYLDGTGAKRLVYASHALGIVMTTRWIPTYETDPIHGWHFHNFNIYINDDLIYSAIQEFGFNLLSSKLVFVTTDNYAFDGKTLLVRVSNNPVFFDDSVNVKLLTYVVAIDTTGEKPYPYVVLPEKEESQMYTNLSITNKIPK